MRKQFFIYLTLIFFNVVTLFAQTQIEGGNVSGVWEKSHSPYIINSDITIQREATLQIEPGVEVKFAGPYKLFAYGRLLAIGTRTDSIHFTAIDTLKGWGGIRFLEQDEWAIQASEIAFTSFSYGNPVEADSSVETEHYKEAGGAILIANSSKVTIRNSLFQFNKAINGVGGAVYVYKSSPTILNSLFRKNFAQYEDGGGAIYLEESPAKIIGCEITENEASGGEGGALYLKKSSGAVLKYLNLTKNSSSFSGSALRSEDSTPFEFSHSEIKFNETATAIHIYNHENNNVQVFRNLVISQNRLDIRGISAIEVAGDLDLINCIIAQNGTTHTGGNNTAVRENKGILHLKNTVVASNNNDYAIYLWWDEGTLIAENSIVLGELDDDPDFHNVSIYFEYSILSPSNSKIQKGEGVLNTDPKFVDPANGNYHLAYDSPAIDAGNPDPAYNDEYLASFAGRGTSRNDIGAYGGKYASWLEKPVTNFAADVTEGTSPLDVQFYNNTFGADEYQWDFDNDGVFESTDEEPKYTFTQGGNFNVKLIAKNAVYADTLVREKFISVVPSHFIGDVEGTWDLDTIFVDGDINVPKGKSLTIMPGTNVYFTGPYTFEVYGQLIANGTESDSIYFFSDSLGRDYSSVTFKPVGHWYGLGFKNTDLNNSPKSEISFTKFKYALTKGWSTDWEYEDRDVDSVGAPIRCYYSSNVYLHDITISECSHDIFGNINLVHSSPKIERINFTNPYSEIDCKKYSNPQISNITIENNSQIFIKDSSPKLDSILFKNNNRTPLYGNNFDGTVKNSVFQDNDYAWDQSGGAFTLAKGSEATFENVVFKNNKATYDQGWYGRGGAGLVNDSWPTFKNCSFIGNFAYGAGGAVAVVTYGGYLDEYTTFKNCLFVKNKVQMGPGAIYTGAKTKLINCTIADNTASYDAAISNDSGQPNIIKNSIIYGNGPQFDQQISIHQAASEITYNIIQGNYYGRDTATTNLHDVDPVFRDTSVNDYHLKSFSCGYSENSPAIDAGDPNIGDFMLDCKSAGLGTKRSDMGAYGGEGNWWDKTIMPDCHFKGEVSGVWDCETIYVEGDLLIPEGDTLKITKNVEWVLIKGPYQITVEGVLIAIGPQSEHANLAGEFIKFQGSNWHGIVFNNLNDRNVGTSIIENCRFDYANRLDLSNPNGGAILLQNSDNVIIRHSVFYANQGKYGGAIYINNSDVEIEGCHFDHNGRARGQFDRATATAGGAIFVKNSNPRMHRLKMIDNYSIDGGGAMALENSSPIISNIMMVRNYTEGLGAAMQCHFGSSPHISNMTVSDNVSKVGGGALYLAAQTNTTIVNSILYGDKKPEIYLAGGNVTVTYSIIDSAFNAEYFGDGCLDTNAYLTNDVDYRLSNNSCPYSGSSTVISPAIDAGHPDSLDSKLDCYAGLGSARADMGYYGGRYSEITVGVENNEVPNEAPTKFTLMQNYPNPFNPTTTIKFALPKAGIVSLKVYNILGQEVATLINGYLKAGFQQVTFNASNLSSGIYFYRLESKNYSKVKKMILLK